VAEEELLLVWLMEGDDNGYGGGFKRSGVLYQKGLGFDLSTGLAPKGWLIWVG